jgi:hypothetical protein
MLDTHWGEKTNPWCVTVQEKSYTAAEKKELKENPPRLPIGTKSRIMYEAIINAGTVTAEEYDNELTSESQSLPVDFIGNLKPGWVAGETEYDSTDSNDQWVIDRDNEQDFNYDLAVAADEGYTTREGSYDPGNFYAQMERNNDPEVNEVHEYTSYYRTQDPAMTQEEFNNGPAKGGTVYNPELEATGPAELTSNSLQMWESYGKPVNTEMVNEDTGAVEFNDGGFEIAFKNGKLEISFHLFFD